MDIQNCSIDLIKAMYDQKVAKSEMGIRYMLPLIFDDTTKKAKNTKDNNAGAEGRNNEEAEDDEKPLTTKPVRENVMSAF